MANLEKQEKITLHKDDYKLYKIDLIKEIFISLHASHYTGAEDMLERAAISAEMYMAQHYECR